MNNKLMLLGLAPILLTGCSEFYGYQPPAPVFGKAVGTNPYERQKRASSQPYKTDSKSVSSEIEKYELPLKTENRSVNRDHVRVKRKAPPAVLALVYEADRSSKAGDLESSVATIERALRIDPRNPDLTYRLAKLRLRQSKPRLAEDLAKKAALLSINDRALKKKSWLLISEARKQQKNYYGAKEAKLKADRL
jgi:tetratricopeptide (TPR) repeat protein